MVDSNGRTVRSDERGSGIDGRPVASYQMPRVKNRVSRNGQGAFVIEFETITIPNEYANDMRAFAR
jgi:hypothetical protein